MRDFASIRDEVMNGIETRVKQAYNAGYKVGATDSDRLSSSYHKGLEEAWECAKKIDRMSAEKVIAIFGSCSNWVDFTATEAIAKIKEYEEKQNQRIKVGDEVYLLDANYKSVVTCVEDNYAVMITQIGKWSVEDIKNIHKTGKHFDDIENVLNLLKGGTP